MAGEVLNGSGSGRGSWQRQVGGDRCRRTRRDGGRSLSLRVQPSKVGRCDNAAAARVLAIRRGEGGRACECLSVRWGVPSGGAGQ